MYRFVKKSLLISIAASGLVLSGAGFASAADWTSATGTTAADEGAVTGNVIQGDLNAPVAVCGDAGTALSALGGATANTCTTENNSASITGTAVDSDGAITGNVIGAAVNAPIQACGLDVSAGSVASGTAANSCDDKNTSATAVGTATDSSGLLSGNVAQLAVNAPIQACGDSVSVLSFDTPANANTCSNG